MRREGSAKIAVIVGGMLIFLQALIHTVLGYSAIADIAPKQTAEILLWAWFAAGIALASFGLLAVYVASWLSPGQRWAPFIEAAIGMTTLLMLVPAVIIGIGYPVLGIVGGLTLLVPSIRAGRFNG